MEIGVIDVIDWQTIVDMRTGRPVQTHHPSIDLASQICAAHPYPGDFASAGAKWVTDTALDLNARYAPDFFFLDYSNVYLQAIFRPISEDDHLANIRAVFDQVERFVDATGVEPVIVGLGDLMEFRGFIDMSDLDGLASAAGMNTRCGGLYQPTERDVARLQERAGVERVVSREDFRAQFGGCDAFYEVCPDYLVFAEPGYIFRGVNASSRPLYRLARPDPYLPLYAPFDGGETITDVADRILARGEGRKLALIVVEGVGCETFPLPFRQVFNGLHWYSYTMGSDQYLALTSGRHFVEYPYPPGYRYELYDEMDAPYPFSGLYRELPEHTIGRRFPGKTAAVGSRSIITHIASGADISLECFARALYNHGVMAVLRGCPE